MTSMTLSPRTDIWTETSVSGREGRDMEEEALQSKHTKMASSSAPLYLSVPTEHLSSTATNPSSSFRWSYYRGEHGGEGQGTVQISRVPESDFGLLPFTQPFLGFRQDLILWPKLALNS